MALRTLCGDEWIYCLRGELAESVHKQRVDIRDRAAALWRAHGRCQMCGRTVVKHHVVLVVDHKIPVEWGGSNCEENLWAMCEDCRFWRTRCSSAWAVQRSSARARVLTLLVARRGRWVARTWLKAVASATDWSRSVRALRKLGFDVRVRRLRGKSRQTMTYYSLSCREGS